jgi:DNA polymerase III delta prime subunit
MHALFCGVTLSGKTTLARALSRALVSQGHGVAIYDPVGSPTIGGGWGETPYKFHDEVEFLDFMNDDRVRDVHVFVDEADMLFNHARRENFWMLSRGRHFGLSMNLITTRPKLLHPSPRSQCTRLYMFVLSKDEAREIGREKGLNNLDAYELDKGDFLIANSASPVVQKANIFHLLERK